MVRASLPRHCGSLPRHRRSPGVMRGGLSAWGWLAVVGWARPGWFAGVRGCLVGLVGVRARDGCGRVHATGIIL